MWLTVLVVEMGITMELRGAQGYVEATLREQRKLKVTFVEVEVPKSNWNG